VNDQVKGELNVVLGHTKFTMDGERASIRTHETNLGDFLCDAVLWGAEESSGTKPDAALWNSGGIRSSIQKGDITLADIKAVLPFVNQVTILKLTGEQLLKTLEASCQNIGLDSFIGAFPQVAGMKFTINSAVPYEKGNTYPGSTFAAPATPGSRVTIEQVGGRPWSATDTYLLATLDFLCQGGDTYYEIKQAAGLENPIMCDFDYEIFAGFLTGPCDHEVPDIYENPQDRIVIL